VTNTIARPLFLTTPRLGPVDKGTRERDAPRRGSEMNKSHTYTPAFLAHQMVKIEDMIGAVGGGMFFRSECDGNPFIIVW
jgi:hypothetical protein